jgi:hypothetical protein
MGDVGRSRLTLFAFLWACQALVHHEFYLRWVAAGDAAGWIVLGFGLALLVRPSSLPLLVGLLVSSIVFNVRKWPFVVNHILLESLVDATVLAALAGAWLVDRRAGAGADAAFRERAYDRFAPVLRAMVVAMYGFAFLAKLNHGFLDASVSCVADMYGDLLRRVPFAPDAPWARELAIWATLAVEGALPLLFAFRRTRGLGVLVGMPFHFMLGAIGHRTFSALAYALYGLFVMDALLPLLAGWRAAAERRLSPATLARALVALRVAAVLVPSALVAACWAGAYRAGVGPFLVYRVAWVLWGLWSLALMAAYFPAALRLLRAPPAAAPRMPAFRWLYASLALVVLNGASQYLGLKTETAFTMYSNLRTEAGHNNHLFLPALRVAGWQDDVVEVLETDLHELERFVGGDEWITYFEFRRITSAAKREFRVRYRRNGGEERWFDSGNGHAPVGDPELAEGHGLLAAKLLRFRPVSRRELPLCAH